jgi:hypothetical protein
VLCGIESLVSRCTPSSGFSSSLFIALLTQLAHKVVAVNTQLIFRGRTLKFLLRGISEGSGDTREMDDE